MSQPSIGDCLSTGVNFLKKNPLYAIVGFLVAAIVGAIPFGLLIGPMMAGYLSGVKKELEGGKAEIGDVFQGFSMLVPGLIVGIIGGIIVMIGFILLVIPGLILMPIPFIGLCLVATGEKDGVAALKRAFALYKSALVPTLITFIVLGIINAVANIIPLGGLVVGPIVIAGLFSYVMSLAGEGGAAADAAPAAEETGGVAEEEEKKEEE